AVSKVSFGSDSSWKVATPTTFPWKRKLVTTFPMPSKLETSVIEMSIGRSTSAESPDRKERLPDWPGVFPIDPPEMFTETRKVTNAKSKVPESTVKLRLDEKFPEESKAALPLWTSRTKLRIAKFATL